MGYYWVINNVVFFYKMRFLVPGYFIVLGNSNNVVFFIRGVFLFQVILLLDLIV